MTEQSLSTVAEWYSDSPYLLDHFSLDRILQIPHRGSQRTENSIDSKVDKFTTGGTQHSFYLCRTKLVRTALAPHTTGKQRGVTVSYPASFSQGQPQHRSILYISHKEVRNSEEKQTEPMKPYKNTGLKREFKSEFRSCAMHIPFSLSSMYF